ncbi:phosphotransferase [Streptomyces celluloflavus]|uniref:Phosphotransferase n=1 Tax=Streptomyces celluloflavus TaxID=58344 RepID=A0ABW7RI84_9ACTN|nr:aminoglycoside phosphotransferase family protein [Streptomyces celluloflavus]
MRDIPHDSSTAYPTTGDVFGYASEQIHRAAAEMWPHVPVFLGKHIPSVTGYVHHLQVGDRPMYAKHSMLGGSLVAILTGAYGTWETVAKRQAAYVDAPDSLLAREAKQLAFLASGGKPQACAVIGLRRGVLFTEPVPGPTLSTLMLTSPAEAGHLLVRAWSELASLRSRNFPGEEIAERSIAGTFRRKFNGLSGETYLGRLGVARLPDETSSEVIALIRPLILRLHRVPLGPTAAEDKVLVYGDLKPEHIVFPDGPDKAPYFIDPGLMRADPSVDAAKLISRTTLSLAASGASAVAAKGIALGIQEFVRTLLGNADRLRRDAMLRRLLVLWCMDTINIMTTYLSAPSAVPLPVQGRRLAEDPLPVLRLVNAASDLLTTRSESTAAWERALDGVSGVGA